MDAFYRLYVVINIFWGISKLSKNLCFGILFVLFFRLLFFLFFFFSNNGVVMEIILILSNPCVVYDSFAWLHHLHVFKNQFNNTSRYVLVVLPWYQIFTQELTTQFIDIQIILNMVTKDYTEIKLDQESGTKEDLLWHLEEVVVTWQIASSVVIFFVSVFLLLWLLFLMMMMIFLRLLDHLANK